MITRQGPLTGASRGISAAFNELVAVDICLSRRSLRTAMSSDRSASRSRGRPVAGTLTMTNVPPNVSPLGLALIAGGFTILGVVLKIAYDSVIAWRMSRNEREYRLAPQRREAYDAFLAATQSMRHYHNAMSRLVEEYKAGRTQISEEEQTRFPHSSLAELTEAHEAVRRLAGSYALITSGDAIVQLFADMTAAERSALETPGPNDQITLFLLQRFLDDRILEFTHSYRQDLGLGHPQGGPKNYPIVDRVRPVSLDESERILRTHLGGRRETMPPGVQNGRIADSMGDEKPGT